MARAAKKQGSLDALKEALEGWSSKVERERAVQGVLLMLGHEDVLGGPGEPQGVSMNDLTAKPGNVAYMTPEEAALAAEKELP